MVKGHRPLTVDDVLPLHGPFVLLLAELVLHGEAPRLGLVVGGVGRQVAEDARVHGVCWGGCKPSKTFVSQWALKTEIIFCMSKKSAIHNADVEGLLQKSHQMHIWRENTTKAHATGSKMYFCTYSRRACSLVMF